MATGSLSKIRDRNAPREYNVTAGVAITPGDFLWWDGTTLRPVGGLANLVEAWSSETQARRNAAARFVGIADFRTLETDLVDRSFAVEVGKVCQVTITSATAPKPGTLLGFEKDAGGNYLYSRQLQVVTHPYDAIGYVVKSYTGAQTSVEAMILPSNEFQAPLANLVRKLSFYVAAATYNAGGTVINDLTFGERVSILAITGVVETLTAGASTGTLSKNADALDETIVIPDAQAVGTVVRTAMVGATHPDRLIFEHDDVFDFAVDGTPTAGAANYILEYMAQPIAV